MTAELKNLEEVPRRHASELMSNWEEVVHLAHQSGSVAIVNGENVVMVLMAPTTYQEITRVRVVRAALDKSLVDTLTKQFEERLAELQKPDARQKLDELLESKGKSSSKPIAGESF